VLLTFSLFIFDYLWEIFRSGSWRGLQNLLPQASILWLTDSLQSTVLSSKAFSTPVVYHRAFRKWKDFATSKFHSCACLAIPRRVAFATPLWRVVHSAFYGIKWAHSMAGIPSPTEVVYKIEALGRVDQGGSCESTDASWIKIGP